MKLTGLIKYGKAAVISIHYVDEMLRYFDAYVFERFLHVHALIYVFYSSIAT